MRLRVPCAIFLLMVSFGGGGSAVGADNGPDGNSPSGSIRIKLCGAFEQPGNYSVNRKSVHIQELMEKIRPILLARKDVALVVSDGKSRLVNLGTRGDETLLRGGEQVYLYEAVLGRRSPQ